MAKSKQDKQYEKLRQTQANMFKDGLNMDLHPLTTPNTVLTDCVNGTMITYNDNEFVLQNERGNTKIEKAKLSPGFIPVGMKEHNGILYIVSYNPDSKETEIGTYPSPVQNNKFTNYSYDGEYVTENIFDYSTQDSKINYYDFNLSISNYDRYILQINNQENPLLVLEHYMLDDNGNVHKLDLFKDNKEHNFIHQSDGILGYKYRPYYISSFSIDVDKASKANGAKLHLNFSSIDKELIKIYEEDDIEFKCDVEFIINGYNEDKPLSELSKSFSFNKENITSFYDIEGKIIESIDINDALDPNFTYDKNSGVLIEKNNKNNKYDTITITATFYICKGNWKIRMDNLIQTINVPVSNILTQNDIFEAFKYEMYQINDKHYLKVFAQLNLQKYDPNWTSNTTYNIGDPTFTISKINKEGNIETLNINIASVSKKVPPKYSVISSDINVPLNPYDLKVENGIYHFTTYSNTFSIESQLEPLTIGEPDILQCTPVTANQKVTKVQYVKHINEDDTTFNIVLLDDNDEIVEIKTMSLSSDCDSIHQMNDGRWVVENLIWEYSCENIECEPDTVYLLHLDFSVNNIPDTASFFVVTTNKMLTEGYTKTQRMDELTVDDWFTPDVKIILKYDDICDITTAKNTLDSIDDIDSTSNVEKLAFNKFLTYDQLIELDTPHVNSAYIPNIGKRMNYTVEWKNNSKVFDIDFNFRGTTKTNSYTQNGNFYKNLYLVVDEDNIKSEEQKYKREYLFNKYSNILSYKSHCRTIKPYKVYKGTSENYLCYEFSVPDKLYGRFYRDNRVDWDDSFLLSEGVLHKDLKTHYVNYLQGLCHDPLQTSNNKLTSNWTIDADNDELNPEHICGTIQIMEKDANLGSFMHYGEIEKYGKKERVMYNGDTKKIWTRGKIDDKFVLLGFNLNGKLLEDIENTYNALLHHWYYLVEIKPRNVVQYIYKKSQDGLMIDTKIKIEQDHEFNGTILPTECRVLKLNLDRYNIQSYNNISKFTTKDYSTNVKTEESKFKISDKCITYLKKLGEYINTYPLIIDTATDGWNFNTLLYDITEKQFSTEKVLGGNLAAGVALPTFYYKHGSGKSFLYKNIVNNTKNYFCYTNADCVPNFNWNYEDEWPFDMTDDTIDLWTNYHSIWFYKLTNQK